MDFNPVSQSNCWICFDHVKTTVTLPCFHHICNPCFEKFTEGLNKICKCPGCRQEFNRDSLINNSVLEQLRELDKEKIEFDPNNLDCFQCEDAASVYCSDCREYYCGTCEMEHLKIRQFKQHKFIPIEEGTGLAKQFTDPHLCTLCKISELSAVCFDCKQAICSDCALDYHLGHNINRLKKIMPMIRETLTAKLEQIALLKNEMQEALVNEKNLLSELEKNAKMMEETIYLHFNLLISEAIEICNAEDFKKIDLKIREDEAAFIQKVQDLKHAKEKEHAIYASDINAQFQALSSVLAHYQTLSTDAALATSFPPLKARCETLVNMPLPNFNSTIQVTFTNSLDHYLDEFLFRKHKRNYSTINDKPILSITGDNSNFQGARGIKSVFTNKNNDIILTFWNKIHIFNKEGEFIAHFVHNVPIKPSHNANFAIITPQEQIIISEFMTIKIIDLKGNFIRRLEIKHGEQQILPEGMSLDNLGNLLIADKNGFIHCTTLEGLVLRSFTTIVEGHAFKPKGVGCLSDDTIIVTSWEDATILAFDITGKCLWYKKTKAPDPYHPYIDADDNILVPEHLQIGFYDKNGDSLVGAKNIKPDAFAIWPISVCIDSNGRIIIADLRKDRVHIY